MYYEAKTANTQLIYRYKQLERAKETLEAAWLAHKRLHQAAGLDVSDDDVYSSSLYQPADVRDLTISQSVSPVRSPHTDDVRLLSATRCPGIRSITTRQGCSVSDDVHCRDPSWPTTAQGRGQDFSGAAFNRTNDIRFTDCGNDGATTKPNTDDLTGSRHLTYPSQSLSSVPCCADDTSGYSDVVESTCPVFDAEQRSTLRSNSDDDGDDDEDLCLLYTSPSPRDS